MDRVPFDDDIEELFDLGDRSQSGRGASGFEERRRGLDSGSRAEGRRKGLDSGSRAEGRRGGGEPAPGIESQRLRRLNLDRLLRRVPQGVAAVVLELSSGTPLRVASLDNHRQEAFDLLGAATTELFHDATVTSIEKMDLEHQDRASERRQALRQIIIQSEHLLYVFLRSRRSPDLVLATLCNANANLGMTLLAARETLHELEEML